MLQSSHVLLLPAVNGLPPELILVSCSAKSATSLHVVPHADRTDRKPAFFTAVCLPRTGCYAISTSIDIPHFSEKEINDTLNKANRIYPTG